LFCPYSVPTLFRERRVTSLIAIDQMLVRGALPDAYAALQQMLEAAPRDVAVRKRLVDVATTLGDTQAALKHARTLAAQLPDDLDATFYLAKAELSAGNLDTAEVIIAKLDQTPAKDAPVFQLLKGNLLATRGDHAAADAAYVAATNLDASYAQGWRHLGNVRSATGQGASAITAWQRYVALVPNDKEVWIALAREHQILGELGNAEGAYERALNFVGDDKAIATLLRDLAMVQIEAQQFDRAKITLVRWLALGSDESAENLLAYVQNELGEAAEAKATLALAKHDAGHPGLARRVRRALLLPQVYASAQAMREARASYVQGLGELLESARSGAIDAAEVLALSQTNFLLAYQGENDLPLQSQYADLIHGLIAKVQPELVRPLARRVPSGKRIKVVYVSSFFRECTVGHYFRSWITGLDAQRFERIVIHTGAQRDIFAETVAAQCDGFYVQRGGVLQVAEAIRAQHADVLIYPEVGMGTMNYLLTNMRLAPVQCAAWGHPVTTGSSQIDYFFTCGEMEGEAADTHYREKLWRLPGIGTSYAAPPLVAPFAREMLGLSAEHRIFICPQSLFKVHPDNDEIFLDIMAADPQAVILFFQGNWPAITQAFGARIGEGLVARGLPARGQVKFLPRVNAAVFRSMLAMCDVVLDTLHWSGGNTSLDALSVGAPIITLPGEFMRGRQTQAMLKTMDAIELIVPSREVYVQRALALASDGAMNNKLREKLFRHCGAIFDRREPITALARHLEEIATH
jgi:protein O-GlcNAc transferase